MIGHLLGSGLSPGPDAGFAGRSPRGSCRSSSVLSGASPGCTSPAMRPGPPAARPGFGRASCERAGCSIHPAGSCGTVNGGGIVDHCGCRRSAKISSPTGHQKCHIHTRENVTLTPKEQTRLQVLNTLLAEQVTLHQAATLMGLSPRHTRRLLAAYRQ